MLRRPEPIDDGAKGGVGDEEEEVAIVPARGAVGVGVQEVWVQVWLWLRGGRSRGSWSGWRRRWRGGIRRRLGEVMIGVVHTIS